MAEFSNSVAGNEDQATSAVLQLEATDAVFLSLPDGFSISDANFESDGSDLILTSADGGQLTVEGFFNQDNPPELVSADGAQISGDMAGQLAGGGREVSAGTDSATTAPADDGMLASNPSIITGTDGEPIGNVENLSGSVFAVRTDGTRVELKEGDSVYQGDIIESSGDGAVGILLADETTFSMGENGRIVLDEMVYDPATQEGSVNLSALQGVFTFVSGQVAKTDPDAMTLDTPVATIGIRGTQVGLDVKPDGQGLNVVLMEEADGFVGEVVIANDGGVQVMNGANQTTSIADFNTAPTEIRVMDLDELVSSFGNALKSLPKVHGNQNDFGMQGEEGGTEGEEGEEGEEEAALDEEVEELEEGEQTAEELEELETAAGDEEEGEGDDLAAAAEEAAAAEAAAAAAAAARAAAEAAAGAQARAAAAEADSLALQADTLAKAAEDAFADAESLAQNVTKDELPDRVSEELGDAVDNMNVLLKELQDLSDDARKAADDAQTAADSAESAAGSANGPAAFAGRDAAQGFLNQTSEALGSATSESENATMDQWPVVLQAVVNTEQVAHAESEEFVALAEATAAEAQNLADQAEANVGLADGLVPDVTSDNLADAVSDGLKSLVDNMNSAFSDLKDLSTQTSTDADSSTAAAEAAAAADGQVVDVAEAAAANAVAALTTAEAALDALNAQDPESTPGEAAAAEAKVEFATSFAAQKAAFAEAVAVTTGTEAFAALDDALKSLLDADDALGVLTAEDSDATPEEVLAGEAALAVASAEVADATTLATAFAPATFVELDMVLTSLGDAEAALEVTTGTFDSFSDTFLDLQGVVAETLQTAHQEAEGFAEDAAAAATQAQEMAEQANTFATEAGDSVSDTSNTGRFAVGEEWDTAEANLNDLLQHIQAAAEEAGVDADAATAAAEAAAQIVADGTTGAESVDALATAVDTMREAEQTLDNLNVDIQDAQTAATAAAEAAALASDASDAADALVVSATADLAAAETAAQEVLDDLIADGADPNGAEVATAQAAVQSAADAAAQAEAASLADTTALAAATQAAAEAAFALSTADQAATTTAQIVADLIIQVNSAESDVDAAVADLAAAFAVATAFSDPALVELDTTATLLVEAQAALTETFGDFQALAELITDFQSATESALQIIADADWEGTDGDDFMDVGELNTTGQEIDGGAGDDFINAGAGDDVLLGGEGSDILVGGEGADTLDGGTGFDIASYQDALQGVIVDLASGTGLDGDAEDDTLINIEGVLGSSFDDTLIGASGDNLLIGGLGSDAIIGGEGTDMTVIVGEFGDYTIARADDGTITVTAPDIDGVPGDVDTLSGIEIIKFGDETVNVLDAAGNEDSVVSVDVLGALGDLDEASSILISGVPTGATLSVGTYDSETDSWTLTPAQVTGLTVNSALNSDEEFSLTISEIDADGAQSGLGFVDIDIKGIADAASFDTDAGGDGGPIADAGATSIPLDIIAGLTNADGSETLTIAITGVPAGATLSAGAYDSATDTWTVSEADLANLSIDSVNGINDGFTLTVAATTTEIDGGNSTSVSGTIPVTIDDGGGGPDAPTLDLNSEIADDQHAGDAAVDEDTSILLDISADLTDPTEELSITIGDISDGATISIVNPSGEDVNIPVINGEAFIPAGLFELGGEIRLTPPPNSDEDFQLTVTATSTDSTGESASTTGTIDIDVAAIADKPQLQVIEATTGDEDTAIALDISSSLTDTDGSETLSVTIAGVPDGATLSAGTKNPDGSWTLAPAMLVGLTVTPPENFNEDFQLTVTATSVELDGGDTSTTDPVTIDVDVIGVADAPTLEVSVSQGIPGGISTEPMPEDPTPDDSSQHQVIGTEGDDHLDGKSQSEYIDGGAGDDILHAKGGADVVVGGEGDDHIRGDGGADDLFGGEGADILSGGAGDDVIDGGYFHEGGEGGGHGHDDSQGDVVLFNGPRDNYIVTENPDGSFTVQDMFAGRDGTDTVIRVENFQFADGTTTEGNLITTNPTTFVIDIDAALTDTDGSEELSITVSGLPEGAFLTYGTNNGDGTWSLTPAEAAEGGLGIIVPYDVQADFSLSVAATSTENDGSTNTVTQVVPLDADAAAPTLDLNSEAVGDQLAGLASGDEDGAIALDIFSSLVYTDGSETLSITIGDVPTGVELSAGTNNGDGTWMLDPADLSGLTVTPAADSDADFTLTVTATSTDGTDTAVTTGTLDVSVAADADAPTLTMTDASGTEDQPISLDISSALTATDGSETLSVTVASVPTGATLSKGTDNGDGTWTLDPADLANLTVTPAADSDADFTLTVTSTSTDGTDTATTSGTMNVSVAADADAPTLTVNDASGTEDQPISLDISSALTDTDGSETLSVTISGVPTGASLSAGTEGPTGTWTLDPADLANLTVTPAADSDADFTLTVTSTSTDGTDTATTSGTMNVSVDADADAPTLTVNDASGTEDTDIPLNISSALTDTDGSETLSVTISGVPAGASLSAGAEGPTGTWTLDPADLANLTVTPAADSNVDFDLTVTATSTDGTDTATTSSTVSVNMTGVADAPTLSISVGDPSIETTGGEAQEVTISSDNVGSTESGFSVAARSLNPDGTLGEASSDDISFNTNPPGFGVAGSASGADSELGFDGSTGASEEMIVSFDSSVSSADVSFAWMHSGEQATYELFQDGVKVGEGTVTGTTNYIDPAVSLTADGGVSFDEIVFSVPSYGDDFLINSIDFETVEGGDSVVEYPLDIDTGLTDTDGLETLSVTVSNLPEGSILSAGIDNGDGSWTVEPVDLSDLSMTVAAGSEDFNLTVTATATEDDGDSATISASVEVIVPESDTDTTAEDPTLTVGPVAGLEDSAIALDISTALTDTDGSETLSVTIAGVPGGATLSAGTDNGDGSWTLDGADVAGLTITPPENSNVDFDLTVTATLTESASGDTASTTATVSVGVTGVADTPTVFTQIDPDTASYQDAVEAREPISYFRMDQSGKDTVVDSAGDLNAKFKKGADSEDDEGGIGDFTGDFDGKDDHIKVDHDESLELPSGSITLWFNSGDVDDKQSLFSKDSSGYDDGGHLTAFVDDGEVEIRLQSGEDSFWVDGGNLSDNTWHQVTFNWGEGGMELYVDGELVDTNDYTGGIENNTEPLVIGANTWSSQDGKADHLKDYFDGQIVEVAIMDHPLTDDDISSLYMTGGHAIQDNGGTVGRTLTDSTTFNLEITGALGDLDGSETLAIVIDNVPDGASLSAGVDNGDGTWTLQPDDLGDLTLNTGHTVIENFELTVTAVSTEDDGDTATAITTVPVIVDATVDADKSIQGSSGDDVLIGGTGDDILKGRGGDDELLGGGSDDTLFGSSGDNTLDGGSGADTLFGSSGKDELKGGEGADTFMFDSQSGHDIVTDILEQDVLVFEGEEFHMDDLILSENNNGDVVVTFGGVEETSVTLDGVSLDDLDKDHDGDPSDGYTVADDGSGVYITIDNVG